MTNEQILTKAIEKAVKGGWKKKLDYVCFDGAGFKENNDIEVLHISDIIFSHDFAKAFWGYGEPAYPKPCKNCGESYGAKPGWQYHLEQMVLEPEPLKYLEKFL